MNINEFARNVAINTFNDMINECDDNECDHVECVNYNDVRDIVIFEIARNYDDKSINVIDAINAFDAIEMTIEYVDDIDERFIINIV